MFRGYVEVIDENTTFYGFIIRVEAIDTEKMRSITQLGVWDTSDAIVI